MKRTYKLVVMCALIAALAAAGVYGAKRVRLAADAALYALPLVIMDLTREEMNLLTQKLIPETAAPDAPYNRFFHMQALSNASSRTVVLPNVDTIYSVAWLDLTAEPVLMRMPPSNGRYFMIQCMDAWTNVFTDPGVRTLGNNGATYAIVGPGWRGRLPEGVTRIQAPTRMVWILGRVYVRDQADLPGALVYQKQLDIRPLSRLNDAAFGSVYPDPKSPTVKRPVMMDILRKTASGAFFERFMKLTVANPAATQDAQFIKEVLDPLGLSVGKPGAWKGIDFVNRCALAAGLKLVLHRLGNRSSIEQNNMVTPSGWSRPDGTFPMGSYGTNYRVRGAIAVWALGANLRADAIYLNASTDGSGKRLEGSLKYTLTFGADGTPPARGFWSITLYDDDGYLIENPIGKYAIKSGDNPVHESDGSLIFYLQPDDPGSARRANWLPTPAGKTYKLILRAYWPTELMLEGRWITPPVLPVK